ncbi:hypothetical protein QJS04_geneDACA022966 [Acorus gramineus]|uniref:NAB domain-containing protein n=1 Tax=Acorus gramineus TaxID=55184 RepID=A0AAV8ZXK0_ACOGR|nr:hypothetical protein QJS04_geneDACA022966 [Acorus gramineus]
MMMLLKKPSYSWWFDSHNSPRRSSWLMSTLSDLDEKTKVMLKLIEQDADSFAQRAEMYYKKRPELVTMVEDFYRAHRSLAEQYDQLKLESEQEEEITKEEVSNKIDVSEFVKLGKDLEILKEKNKVMKAELMDKDEEKREVIRQLSMALEILKEENICLKKCIKDSTKKKGLFEFNAKWKKSIFSGKLFGGNSKFQPIVAL